MLRTNFRGEKFSEKDEDFSYNGKSNTESTGTEHDELDAIFESESESDAEHPLPVVPQRFACPHPNCGKTFEKERLLARHEANKHSTERKMCREPGCTTSPFRFCISLLAHNVARNS